MSNRTQRRHGRVGIAAATCFAFLAIPGSSIAAPVDLQTASDYAVLGGATVTNTGSSVLNGDLGVYPGLALPGFGPATVNGETHAGDADAQVAQSDLTTAYNVAAGQTPVTRDLTGVDLGGLILTPGVYTFDSSAQLTGTLTLNNGGDPDAQFVFRIVSGLTTASNSSVVGSASACNVYWQVGSSATLGTNTAFRGNVMADQSISLNNGTSLFGRALARIGQVSLDDNVVDAAPCGAGTSSPPPSDGSTPGAGTTPADGTAPPTGGNQTPPQSRSRVPTRKGSARLRRTRNTPGSRRTPGSPRVGRCTTGFYAAVRGRMIKRVVFRLDGRRIASRRRSPFRVYVRARSGRHNVSARVTFKDATRAKTLNLGYRGCAAKVLRPKRGPSPFTG